MLRHNIRAIRAWAAGAGVLVAVKADGYGHGAVAVSRLAESEGLQMLAGANLEELYYLRDTGTTLPVLVLEDLFPEEIEPALRADAHLNVSSLAFARRVSETAQATGLTAFVHVNVDTGMGRMGLRSEDPAADIEKIARLPGIRLEGVFSHFPSADEPDKAFAYRQIDAFNHVVTDLRRRGVTPRFLHMANSSALLDIPGPSRFDLVRPGIATYGIYAAETVNREIDLRPAMKLTSRIVKITHHTRDWPVGYGRTYTAKRGTVIGVIPIGYGDGYSRAFSNRGSVLVHGARVPIVGRVSMDMITVDLTDLPEPPRLYDEAVLMGPQRSHGRSDSLTCEELAATIDVIPYEIICGLTARVPRVYIDRGRTVATQTLRHGYEDLVDAPHANDTSRTAGASNAADLSGDTAASNASVPAGEMSATTETPVLR